MRVFVAGASGAIGTPLVRQLVAAGHVVAGMTRTPEKAPVVESLGALPVVCDAYDAEALRAAMAAFVPEVVVNELTDLPDDLSRIVPEANARMRREGNANLIASANGARYLAQSVAWELAAGVAADAVRELERATLEANGVVLRYGMFYGDGTYYPASSDLPPPPRIHIEEAARRTVEALTAASGVIVIAETP
ncbi:MAG TPA: NAD(P)H-binding protein [Gaiellaceae bacterium]|jgi:uncharacterized protein YbjT (DUF2867 family)|nr:NAD(P)H-binding protein [Gaiellaceae bacterium]